MHKYQAEVYLGNLIRGAVSAGGWFLTRGFLTLMNTSHYQFMQNFQVYWGLVVLLLIYLSLFKIPNYSRLGR